MADKTFTFNIKAIADMKDVTSNIQNIQNALKKLKLPDNLNASFKKNFGELEKELERYQKLKAGGFKTNSDATALEKSGKNIVHLYSEIVDKINSLDGSQLKKAFEELGGKEVEKLKNDLIDLQNQLKQQISTQNLINVDATKKGLQGLKKEITGLSGEAEKAWSTLSKNTFNTFAKNLQDGRLDLAANNLEKIGRQVQEINKVDLTKWYIQLEESFAKLQDSSGISNTTQQIEQLKSALNTAKVNTIAKLMQDFDGSAKSADELLQKIRELTTADADFGRAQAQTNKELEQVKSRIQYFFGLNNAINLVKRAIRGAFDTIKSLDKAMTETAVVTNFSVGDMWKQLPEYTKRANELGVTTQAAYEAATLYYQQGLKTNEVNALSVETLKMARIAGLDAAEATDRMTNALRGFNMELTEANAQRVDDVYSELAANTASNVDEISTAMTKVASLAHNANMEFETTAAFLAQIIETTRESAETAGTALKTVVARFTEVKKLVSEGALSGTDEEGQAIDVNKVSAALRTAGIDMNQYFLGQVNLNDIFMELASKWDSLTALQQRYIATQAAGSRQQSRFIAMMSDYARTQELVGKAYQANGASARQFEKTQESLESKLARLKNAWNEFLMGLTNSTVVKSFVDLLTNLLNTINSLTSAFGDGTNSILKWGVALGGIFGGKALFDSTGFAKMLQGFASFGKGAVTGSSENRSSKSVSETIRGWAEKINDFSFPDIADFDEKINKTVKSVKELGKSFKTLFTAIWPYLTILIAAGLVGWLGKKSFELENEMKDPTIKLKKQATAMKEYSDNMDSLDKKAQKTNESLKQVQQQSQANMEAINSAYTTESRSEAIAAQNDYIKSLIAEGTIKDEWVQAIDDLDGRIILTLDDKAVANAVKEAAEAAAKTTAVTEMAHGESYLSDSRLLEAEIARIENEYIEKDGKYYRKRAAITSFTGTVQGSGYGGVAITPEHLEEIDKDTYLAQMDLLSENQKQIDQNNIQFQKAITAAYSSLGSIYGFSGANLNTASLALGQVFDISEYTDAVSEKIEELINNATTVSDGNANKAIEYLRNEYFRKLGVEADLTLDESSLARAIATATVQSGWNKNIQATNALIESDSQAKALAQALNGELELNTDNLEEILPQADELADAMGIDINDFVKTLVKAQQTLAKKKIGTINTYGQTYASAGGTLNSELADQLASLPIDRLELLNSSAEKLSQISPPDQLLGSLEKLQDLAVNDAESFKKVSLLLNSINLSNPINAFNRLEEAINSGDKELKAFAEDLKTNPVFTNTGLFQSFISSDAYSNITKSLDKLIKKNGNLTADNITELAESCEELQFFIDKDILSAEGLARALTLIQKGSLDVNNLNDVFLKVLNTVQSVDEKIKNLHDWMSNFNKGLDYGEPSDFFKDLGEELDKFIKGYEFGNERTINLYEAFFGKGSYKQMYNEWIAAHKGDFDPAAFAAFMKKQVDQATALVDNNSYGFMDMMANKGLLGITRDKNDKYNFDWDVGTKTTEELLADIKAAYSEATGKEIGEEFAMALLEGWLSQSPDTKFLLDQNNFEAALNTLYDNAAKNSKAVTEEQIASLRSLYHLSEKEAKTIIERIRKQRTDIPIIIKLTDGKGNPLTGERLMKQVNELGIDFKNGDVPTLIEQLLNNGLSYAQAVEAINNKAKGSDIELKATVKKLDENGKTIEETVTGKTVEEVESAVQLADKALQDALLGMHLADQLSQPIEESFTNALNNALNSADAEGFAERLGNSVAEAIRNVLYPEETAGQRAAEMSKGGNVDLNHRPRVSAETMQKAGYTEVNAPATVYSRTYSGQRGSDDAQVAINVTPILPDGRILTEGALEQYANEMIRTGNDPLQLRIGPEFIGDTPEEAMAQAQEIANQIHIDQETLYENVEVMDTSDIIDEEGLSSAVTTAIDTGSTSANATVTNNANTSLGGGLSQAWSNFVSFVSRSPLVFSIIPSLLFGGVASGGIVRSFASGSDHSVPPGFALTGEEGPEIIWNKNGGYAYITGQNGAQFQNLQPGDRIFNAAETKRIFKNSSFAKGGIFDSFVNGTGHGGYNSTIINAGKKNKGGGSGGSGSGSKDSEKESTWRNELDWLYNLMEDIVELERDQKAIEEEYEDLLKDQTKTGGDLYRLLVKQLGNLYTQLDHQNFALRKREQEMREFMDKTNDQDKYLWYNWKDRTLEIDWDAIDKIQDEEQYKHVKELVDEAEAIQDKIDDADDSIMDITNQIQELENIWRDTFTDFESRVLDAIIKSYQQIIDNYSELNDTLNDSNSQILDSLQKQISLERQIRDNTKTEEEITDEEARLAYLRRDTSGGNDLAALQLEQELADQRQDYEDTLVDQAISRLQEDNDAAAQQRERQIEIMQAQLDYQSENGEFNAYVSDLLTSAMGADGELLTNSDLVTLLKEQENWDAMSAVSKEVWDEELNGTFKEVAAFLLKQNAEENGTFYTALTAAVKSVSSAIGSYSQAMTKMGSQIASATSGGGGSSGGRSGNGKDKGKGGTDFENELVGMTKPVHEDLTTSAALKEKFKLKKMGRANGGLVSQTGIGMLHGTIDEPEYVLNARQTDAFLKLADILPSMMSDTLSTTSNTFGSTYVNLSVNLESVSPDYDVDRMVSLVKDKLYDAGSYRNVNSLSFLR